MLDARLGGEVNKSQVHICCILKDDSIDQWHVVVLHVCSGMGYLNL